MIYQDHYDDGGYRAYGASKDMDELQTFSAWLTEHDIGWNLVRLDDERDEEELDCVWTDFITDKAKAMLTKLTWGGAQ